MCIRDSISLEDDVMRLFGSERIAPMIEKLGMTEDQPLEAGMLTKQIEGAQKRIEGRNYSIRTSVLQYDDVMNKQRELIYGQRRDILMGHDVRQNIIDKMCIRDRNWACASPSKTAPCSLVRTSGPAVRT